MIASGITRLRSSTVKLSDTVAATGLTGRTALRI
jgi:hypothetical protein